jgi:RNA-binding protein
MTLTGRQRRHLRALGHHLEPVVQLGKHGLTDAVIRAADVALTDHELIKIRRGSECPDDRHEIAASLASALAAEVVQELGHTVLLYRRHEERPLIELP